MSATQKDVEAGMRVQEFGTLEVSHDPSADALFIRLAHGKYHFTAELDEDRFLDYSKDGVILGVEILGVSEGISMEGLPRCEEIAHALEAMGIPTIQKQPR